MNFPKSQKTGRQAELAVTHAFLDWDWNVGQDQIDTGYDLCITPDYTVYQGIHFLVQVKGTSIDPGSRRLTAQVAKSRLRQYANNVLPVFIFRVTPDRTIYWVHAQAWAKEHRDKVVGEGKGLVTFDASRMLKDRDGFECYLREIVKPLLQTRDPLAIGQQPSIDLAQISARRAPSNSESATQEEEEFSVPAQMRLSFTPVGTAENIARVRDAHLYGFPRTFEVNDFSIAPLPGRLGLMKPLLGNGRVTMRPHSSVQGFVLVCPGKEYSVLAQELSLAAELFKGTNGAGITNEFLSSALDIVIRIDVLEASIKAGINISIRGSAIYGKPLRDLTVLAPLATWAEQVAAENAMWLTLEFNGTHQALTPPVSPITPMLPVFQRIRSLSRLHMVTRALKSSFILEESDVLSEGDFQDIDFGFDVLRGAQKSITVQSMKLDSVNPEAKKALERPGEMFIRTHWELDVAGKLLGHLPVEIHLMGYTVEGIPGSDELRIAKGENGQAWVTYTKHAESDGHTVRRKL